MKKTIQYLLTIQTIQTVNKKIYNSLSRAKGRVFAFALSVFSLALCAQTTYTFNYTGSAQTLALPAGNYSIECWGGDGGDGFQSSQIANGGKGGYSTGLLNLGAAQTISIYVGGAGTNANGTTAGQICAGGFNGGGASGANNYVTTSSYRAGGGGGGSDVRVGGSALTDRVIVAGGGGGGVYSTSYPGGNGGGTSGANGGNTYHGNGGTQTAGGLANGSTGNIAGANGALGTGGNGGTAASKSGGGGGGGGYYGGAGGATGNSSSSQGGGGGGSGYIGGVSSATTIGFGQAGFVANPDVTGNGIVKITELCNITLSHNGAGTPNVAQLCAGQSLTLTTNAIANYSWTTGATTSSLVVSPTSNTVYGLTATSPATCTASANITVSVSVGLPTLSIVSSTNQTCVGKTATLTASGASTYTWSNGVSNGVSFFPQTTTTYSVTGENGCGTVQAVSTISVAPLSVTALSTSSTVCTNQTATISVTAAATDYTFNPGNVMGQTPNLIINPQSNTVYTITASDGTCSGVANVTVNADPVPTLNIAASSSIMCPGGVVTMTASGGNNYTWSPGNQNGASISVNPTQATLYTLTGDNSFGCVSNTTQVVVVGAKPNLLLTASSSAICKGETATVSVSGADSYSWLNGGTGTVNVVSPTQNTVYSVTGTNSTTSCTDTQTISITVFDPVLAISGNTTICNGQTASLTANGATSYTWIPVGAASQAVNVTPATTTVYTVSAISSSNNVNCPVSGTIQVVVNQTPIITTTSAKPAICAKETNTITANGASTYTWTSAATTSVGTSIVIGSPMATIVIYTVSGTDVNGCAAEITVPFSISACTGLATQTGDQWLLEAYPNPNNGEFTITANARAVLHVVNELGQQVRSLVLDEKNNFSEHLNQLAPGIYFVHGDNARIKVVVTK